MDLFFVVRALQELLWIVWIDEPSAPFYALKAAPQYVAQRISAPSSSTEFVPNTVPTSPVLASTVPIIEDSCLVSDFTSTLWFCPTATATATASATTITTSTSTPIFSPSHIPEPVVIQMLAPGLPITAGLGITALVVFIVALLIQYAFDLGQVKGAQRPVAPAEAPLSCSESIVASTSYDWHDSDSLGSVGQFAGQEGLFDIVWTKWHDDYMLQRIDKLESYARERNLQAEIRDINAACDDRESILRNEIAAINSARNDREDIHQKEMATEKRSHQNEIEDIKTKHKRELAAASADANNQRRRLREEAKKRQEAEDKLEAYIKAGMLTTYQPKPTAETSPQDVAPGAEDQLPSLLAATESSIPELEEALPVTIPSPITEAEDKLHAETEGLSEAESTNSTEHEQEQEEEKEEKVEEEEEPHNSGTPLPGPSLMGEGAEQIPQDQEKGLAQDAPVPIEEPAAATQLTEPETAPGPATSDDGASEAPVTTRVLPEEQTGDGETEEPTAVEESDEDEIRGTAAGDDGAFVAPASKESDQPLPPWHSMLRPHGTLYVHRHGAAAIGDLLDEVGSMGISGRVKFADDSTSANLFEASKMVARLLSPEPPSAVADDSGDEMECETSDETSSSGHMVVDHEGPTNDPSVGQPNPVSDVTSSPDDMDTDDNDATANDPGTEQSNSTDEIDGDSPMDDDSSENAAKDSENGSSNRAGEEWLGSDMVQDGGNGTSNGIGYQLNNATPERAQLAHQTYGSGQVLSSQSNIVPTTEMAQPSHQARGNNQVPPSQSNDVPPMETAPSTWQRYKNAPPPQLVRPLPGSIPLRPSSGPIKWNLSGPATIWRPLQWRGAIEWDLSRPPTFPRPFRISQPAQKPFSNRQGLPKLRVLAQPSGSKVAAQGLQNTQSFKWQPPPQPVTQANPPLASPPKDRLLVKAVAINTWVKAAITLCDLLERSPEEGGVDAKSFRVMKNDPNSEISKIIADTALTATSLESELKQFDMTIDARTVLRFLTLREVLSMREKCKQLIESKGCPELFVFWLQDIDRMLKGLRDLVPESSTPQAQFQSPRVNPLLSPTFKDKPVDVAKEILAWVADAKKKCHSWEFDPEEGGTDADFFKEMNDDVFSPLCTIFIQMGDVTNYLEHERETGSQSLSAASSYYRFRVAPLVESMRGQYKELGALKECPEVFEHLLIRLDRVLEILGKLKEESSTPPSQRQPAALSTQQIPPQQPVSQVGNPSLLATHPQPAVQATQQIPPQQTAAQTANPLYSFDPPSSAAKEIKRWMNDYKSTALPAVVQQMAWAVEYIRNRKSVSAANRVFRGCLGDVNKMHQYYQKLGNEHPHYPVFASLVEDINRVWDELRKIK